MKGSQGSGNQSNVYCFSSGTSPKQDCNRKNPNYLVNLIDIPNRDSNMYEVTPGNDDEINSVMPISDQPLDFTLPRKEQVDCEDGSVWRPW